MVKRENVMLLLKKTEEYRTENEVEAKELMDDFRGKAIEEGYEIGALGYTYKEKRSKGEVIDSAYIVKIVKNFNKVFEV